MSDEPADSSEDEEDEVRAWRVLQAMCLGFEWADAVRIADNGTDLHQLADLIEAECPHVLAAEIARPD